MQLLPFEGAEHRPTLPVPSRQVLGTSFVLNLETFPELHWLTAYLTTLTALQQERERLNQAIQALSDEGDVYRDCWIEPYTKTKNGQQYAYHQLRWLTGERKPSGQPKVKTKHLSQRVVGAVRAAIARGQQAESLEQQREQVEVALARLKQLVGGTGRRLQRLQRQLGMTNPLHTSFGQEGNDYKSEDI